LYEKGGKDLPELVEGMQESGARGKTSGVLEGAKKAITGRSSGDDDDEDEERRPVKKAAPRRRRTQGA
jgi:hypothetical protein